MYRERPGERRHRMPATLVLAFLVCFTCLACVRRSLIDPPWAPWIYYRTSSQQESLYRALFDCVVSTRRGGKSSVLCSADRKLYPRPAKRRLRSTCSQLLGMPCATIHTRALVFPRHHPLPGHLPSHLPPDETILRLPTNSTAR